MEFSKKLLGWYQKNARMLPWRTNPSAYKTVVSEFMLQQTQVETVLRYFEPWINRFPNFEALASATEIEVVKYWEGLGYYSRAKNLRNLAINLIHKPLPTTASEWKQFKGIGPYTAAAIASIAFNDPSAVVDGNVIRVLSRITATNTLFKNNTDGAKCFQQKANDLIDKANPGDYNQAIMELGAKICTKHNPQCSSCPVISFCVAHKQNISEQLPRFVPQKTITRNIERILLITNERILLSKTDALARRLSSIYELPEMHTLQLSNLSLSKIATKTRSISKERIIETIFTSSAPQPSLPPLQTSLEWIPIRDLDKFTLSGPHKRWVKELLPHH